MLMLVVFNVLNVTLVSGIISILLFMVYSGFFIMLIDGRLLVLMILVRVVIMTMRIIISSRLLVLLLLLFLWISSISSLRSCSCLQLGNLFVSLVDISSQTLVGVDEVLVCLGEAIDLVL